MIKKCLKYTLDAFLAMVFLPFLLSVFLFMPFYLLFSKKRTVHEKRLLWGCIPLKSLTYTSKALQEKGFESKTVVIDFYPIVKRSDFDVILRYDASSLFLMNYIITQVTCYLFFIKSLFSFDIFHYFFDGGILQRTPYTSIEFLILKACGKHLILMPYGSDSFVYDHLYDLNWRHALLSSYSGLSKNAHAIERMLRLGAKYADIICGCLVHVVNLPRWDVLPLTWYPFPTHTVTPVFPKTAGPVFVAHAPNHRGVKGTEFLMDAVARLHTEGYDIHLTLIEKKTNDEALDIMKKADIIVDQLIFGYALNAMESMALGKITITGVDKDHPSYTLFSRYSYLKECPALFASPESIYNVLKDLLHTRHTWPELGQKMRAFAEKRHSFESSSSLFQFMYKTLEDPSLKEHLLQYYHPLFEKSHENSSSS